MLSKSSKKVVLVAMMALHLAIALFTTIPGVGARSLGVYLQTDPFIYLQNEEVKLPDAEDIRASRKLEAYFTRAQQ